MSLTQSHHAGTAYERPDAALSGEALRIAVYLEFLYGFGAAPGVDLGAPKAYSRVLTTEGSVYRQDFEHGVTIANIGDDAVDVILDPPLYDLDNTKRTSLRLPGHSAEVLRSTPRVTKPRRAS